MSLAALLGMLACEARTPTSEAPAPPSASRTVEAPATGSNTAAEAARAAEADEPSAGHEPLLPPPSADEPVAADGAISFRDLAGLPRPFVGMRRSQDAVVDRLRHATPTGFRPVGSTSTVFHMTLDAPFAAAFKTATHGRPLGPAAEVAAYRLSRCLGLNNVPPAVSRQIPEPALRSAFEREPGQTWQEISERLVRKGDQLVPGAAIYWIPDLVDIGLDEPEMIARWTRWLKQGQALPEDQRALSAHVSTMVVFDYLIGNFDRFSGGNARGNPERTVVYFRDHDIAFGGRLPPAIHKRVLSRMLRAERFSRSFYRALTGLTRGCFMAELARDPGWQGGKLLGRARIDGVFERLQTARSHIDSLIQLHGRDKVLVFP